MRSIIPAELERGRVLLPNITNEGLMGAFRIHRKDRVLRIISSTGLAKAEEGWEHVSVSMVDRIPTWEDMCYVKGLFWTDEETVIQFHPPKSLHINCHPNCLHLWRQRESAFPLPPSHLV